MLCLAEAPLAALCSHVAACHTCSDNMLLLLLLLLLMLQYLHIFAAASARLALRLLQCWPYWLCGVIT